MNSLWLLVTTILVVTAHAQFENGFVKILEDQRYQDGATFGNFRNQEDGIRYKEETNALGVRTGFWEYPDENGRLVKVEFEAGPGIGFRIVSSNVVDPTPQAAKTVQPQVPVQRAEPRPVVKAQSIPQFQQIIQPVVQTRQQVLPVPQTIPIPLVRQQNNVIVARQPELITHGPINIFDYPADLQFFRDAGGHRFKFTAV